MKTNSNLIHVVMNFHLKISNNLQITNIFLQPYIYDHAGPVTFYNVTFLIHTKTDRKC